MRSSLSGSFAALATVGVVSLAACSPTNGGVQESQTSGATTTEDSSTYSTVDVSDGKTDFVMVTNPNGGAVLSYTAGGPFSLLDVEEDGFTYAFKDMNANGQLDPWEDWRLPAAERAADLAPQLTLEQMAGLMLFSPSEYAAADGLTDVQRAYLKDDKLRLVLNSSSNDVEANVKWSNQVQDFVESLASEELPYIPVNMSTDPRSDASGGYHGTATADISMWPGNLGLAATFDPELARRFGHVAGAEYRALGMTNVLSPQVDLASDPRWLRANGTFGENVDLSQQMTEAFVDGFQSTLDEDGNNIGWGKDSVSAVIKHFAGDAAGEGGRPSYDDSGKFAVFPGDNFDEHLEPFRAGLDASGLMTTYSILVDAQGESLIGEELVAGAYNKDLVDIMRVDNNSDGVIMTDWGVTAGGPTDPEAAWFTNWGVEELTVDERHFLILAAGVDMFGGNTDVVPVMAAHDMWQQAYEEGTLDIDADARFQQSADRILTVIFQSGLYDNPYLDLEVSKTIAGSEAAVAEGYEAQVKSVVVLKNDEQVTCAVDPVDWSTKTVYIPGTYDIGVATLRGESEYTYGPTIEVEAAEQYFAKVVTDEAVVDADGKVTGFTQPNLDNVDLVLVGMSSPNNGYDFGPFPGYDPESGKYLPISLQYSPYTADSDSVRKVSISGNILPDGTRENRSYFGNTARISNAADLEAFERGAAAAESLNVPVVTLLKAKNPIIPAEFEKNSNVIAVGFDISEAALIEVALGMEEASGRLPMSFPANMETVEASYEDVSGDFEIYKDSVGNSYEFGYGLTCDGSLN